MTYSLINLNRNWWSWFKKTLNSNEIIILYKNLIHFLDNIDFAEFFDQLHQFLFKFIDEYVIRFASLRQIEWFNQRLKILNIYKNMKDFVYRFIVFYCICMRLYISIINNIININWILIEVESLESAHWVLHNELFCNWISLIFMKIIYIKCR